MSIYRVDDGGITCREDIAASGRSPLTNTAGDLLILLKLGSTHTYKQDSLFWDFKSQRLVHYYFNSQFTLESEAALPDFFEVLRALYA